MSASRSVRTNRMEIELSKLLRSNGQSRDEDAAVEVGVCRLIAASNRIEASP